MTAAYTSPPSAGVPTPRGSTAGSMLCSAAL
jgi:hypothetical protein